MKKISAKETVMEIATTKETVMEKAPTKEIVIASYKEPMEWVTEIPSDWKVTVYNTCETPRAFPKGITPIALPNVGREAGQWVFHLYDRYQSLADFTMFCQADKLHVPAAIDAILKGDLPTRPFSYLGVELERFHYPHPMFEPHRLLLQRVWLDEPIPEVIPFMVGAQFYVTKKTVENRPREHYKRLLDTIREQYPPMQSSAHLLEACWGCVFQINRN